MALYHSFLQLALNSNEHMPEHVHVKNGSGKARFDISDGVQLVESKGMKLQELKRAQEIAEEEIVLLEVA